jgi:hypothetical protein
MKNINIKWNIWIAVAVITIFSPAVLVAAFISPNEYVAQGITGAVDCDGPISIMIFAVPSYLIYGIGGFYSLMTFLNKNNISSLIASIICFVFVLSIIPNTLAAIKEHKKNETEHSLTCGKGW